MRHLSSLGEAVADMGGSLWRGSEGKLWRRIDILAP